MIKCKECGSKMPEVPQVFNRCRIFICEEGRWQHPFRVAGTGKNIWEENGDG
jgi:hypothetical protein